MRITSRTSDETGVALITALLATLLAAGLMAGMFAALNADQKSHSVDRDQSQAYAAAHAGLEKLTSGLAQLFAQDFSPSQAQLNAVSSVPPTIPGFTYTSPDGSTGYALTYTADGNGNPQANPNADITTGPFIGFKGLITPYMLTVTARSNAGSEVRLRRELQTVAVPVFQFGIFGEKSLSFHAGANFDFGGRVHTNEHLFIASGNGATLTFRDKLTATGEVVRRVLENTNTIENSTHDGTVAVPTVIGTSSRNLAKTEGSVATGPGSAFVNGWKNLSEVTYNTNIRNYKTGAKRLDLPLVSQGATPIDLIRRPALNSNEDAANAPVYGQRYFAQASLRILLSDRVADLMPPALPGVTNTPPIALDGSWNPGGALPPVGLSIGPNSVAITGTAGTGNGAVGSTVTMAAVPNWLKAGGVAVANLTMQFGAVTVSNCTGVENTAPNPRLTGCTTAGGTGTTPLLTNALVAVALDPAIGGGTVPMQTANAASTPAGAGNNRAVPITAASLANLTMGARTVWSGNNPVTCLGYTATTLTYCYWTTAPTGSLTTHALQPAGNSRLGGFIKIEKQDSAGVWSNVTAEILGLGFSGRNQEPTATLCADPTPTAVIRLQRLRDHNGPACNYGSSQLATDQWPNALYDGREGSPRNLAAGDPIRVGGVMSYVTLDVGNLNLWLTGAIGVTGATTLNNNGFIVYFSDRRGNHNDAAAGQPETGEYGFEDSINPATAAGTVNNQLDGGEDRNEDSVRQTYGYQPSAVSFPVGSLAPFNAVATPWTTFNNANTSANNTPAARINPQVLFRRALKITNGAVANIPVTGLTVAAENPVYVQGDYNATAASVTGASRPAAIIADAITILSNSWRDTRSFNNDIDTRLATTTGYRFAMIGGKSIAFAKPAWTTVGDMGTDGGVHNFMRMLENWSGQTIRYRGSMVSLYTARQAIGIYRASDDVYAPGTREFSFDTNFLTPALLPPGTPMFRDINTLKFRQILRPNQ